MRAVINGNIGMYNGIICQCDPQSAFKVFSLSGFATLAAGGFIS